VTGLVEFLRARLNEREQMARAASPGPWRPNAEHDEVVAVDDVTVAEGFALSGRQLRATVDHIAANDPTYVLADVAAKRAILAKLDEYAPPWSDSRSQEIWETIAEEVVPLLAASFKGHPDFPGEAS
jgi:hypothetical protein